MSQAKLSKIMEVSQSTIWRWENDEGEPDGAALQHLHKKLGVEPTWILTGDGVEPDGVESVEREDEQDADSEFVFIDRYAARPTGGHGGSLDDLKEGKFPLLAEVARKLGHPGKKLCAVRVRGNSMEPTYPDDGFVIVWRNTEPINGIVVLEAGGELVIKQLERDIETGGYQLISHRPGVPMQRIGPDKDPRVIGHVLKGG